MVERRIRRTAFMAAMRATAGRIAKNLSLRLVSGGRSGAAARPLVGKGCRPRYGGGAVQVITPRSAAAALGDGGGQEVDQTAMGGGNGGGGSWQWQWRPCSGRIL